MADTTLTIPQSLIVLAGLTTSAYIDMDYPEIIPSKSVFKYYCHLIVTRHKTSQETPQIRHFLALVHYSNSSRVYYRQLINADISRILDTSISPNIALFASFSKLLVAN